MSMRSARSGVPGTHARRHGFVDDHLVNNKITRSHRENIMYNIFMTNVLIHSQLGHIDRLTVMNSAGLTDALDHARVRNSAAFFFRKKS